MITEQNCPVCGMKKTEWTENAGNGVEKDGRTYCCAGCAEGTGCTCKNRDKSLAPEDGRMADPAHMYPKDSV